MPEEWIGIRHAARLLGVHENTVRNMVAGGRLAWRARPTKAGYTQVSYSSVRRLAVKRRQVDPETAARHLRVRWVHVGNGVIMPEDWQTLGSTVDNSIAVTNSVQVAIHIVDLHNASLPREHDGDPGSNGRKQGQ